MRYRVQLGSLLPISKDKVFETGQLLRSHGAARVHLARGDPDFGTHAEFTTIRKLRRGVVHHHSRVHSGHKWSHRGGIFGHDGIGVPGRMGLHESYRILQPVHYLYRHNITEIFGIPIRIGCRAHVRDDRLRLGVTAQFAIAQRRDQIGQEAGCDAAVDHNAFSGAANASPAHLGILNDPDRLL